MAKRRKKTDEELQAEMNQQTAEIEKETIFADDPPYNGPMPDDAEAGAPEQEPAPEPEPEGEAIPPQEVVRKNTVKRLPCRLTDAEFLDRAVLLAKTTQDMSVLESRHADLKAEMKAEISKLDAERNRLAGIVARREEMRDVGVEIVYDFPTISVYEVRKDTGEEMSRRAMTDNERQMPLPV